MKKRFKKDDIIKLPIPFKGEHEFAELVSYDKSTEEWVARPKGQWEETIHLKEDDIVLCPPFTVTKEFLQKLLRYEITYQDYVDQVIPTDNWVSEGPHDLVTDLYKYDLADMMSLVHHLKEKAPTTKEIMDWAELIDAQFGLAYWNEKDIEHKRGVSFLGFNYPTCDDEMAVCIYNAIFSELPEDLASPDEEYLDLSQILADIDNYQMRKPIKQHRWSIRNKLVTLPYLDEHDPDSFSFEARQELRELIIELAEKGYPDALHHLAFSFYGGNKLLPCDWANSRDAFLKLMSMEEVDDLDKCIYANSLGYIYYYGRCNGGIPEYEEAFHYFSLGAAGGIFESIYKLADMYAHGYGVEQNSHAAASLINLAYSKNLELFTKGHDRCQLADVMLRAAELCRDDLFEGEEAYYLLVADYAIRKRLRYGHYGDQVVFNRIQNELARVQKERPVKECRSISNRRMAKVVSDLLNGHTCRLVVTPLKKGLKIALRRLPAPGKDVAEGVFECYIDHGYCDLITEATVTVMGDHLPQLDEKLTFMADHIEEVWDPDGYFYVFSLHGAERFCLKIDQCTRKFGDRSSMNSKEHRFVSVLFERECQTHTFLCDLPGIKVGDPLVVKVDGEERISRVVRLFRMDIEDMPLPLEDYKKRLRKL